MLELLLDCDRLELSFSSRVFDIKTPALLTVLHNAMSPSSEIWVVTGASKGIGAALVSQILKDEKVVVFAGARRPSESKALEECKRKYGERIHLVKLDVTDHSTIQAAAKQVAASEGRVDVLVNNAAITESLSIPTEDITPQHFRDDLETNVIGPHVVLQAFYTLLEHGKIKKVINISSTAGSINTWAGLVNGEKDSPVQGFKNLQAAYRSSKAALNSVTVSWALRLSTEEGYTVIALHPGIVKSDTVLDLFKELGLKMDDFGAVMEILTTDESAGKIIDIIHSIDKGDSGKFLDYNGKTVPF